MLYIYCSHLFLVVIKQMAECMSHFINDRLEGKNAWLLDATTLRRYIAAVKLYMSFISTLDEHTIVTHRKYLFMHISRMLAVCK